jgi:hypothetical protein
MKPSFRLPLLAASVAAAAFAAQAQSKPSAPVTTAQAPAPNAGIVSNPEFEKAGQTAAHAWLLLLDRRDWGTAWDASSAVFRKNVPLGTWMDRIPEARAPFGAFVEREPVAAVYKKSLEGYPAGDYVTVIFRSQFAQRKDLQESVTTVREPDGRWRVTGYSTR